MRQVVNRGFPPQQECEVCRAATALQHAVDALNTFLACGGVTAQHDRRVNAVALATTAWNYAKGGRHTGIQHTPVVVGTS